MNPPQTAAKQVIDLSTLTLPGSRPVFRPTGRRQGSNHPYSQPTSDHSPLVTMPTVITGSSGGSPTAPVAPVTSHNANPVKRRGRPPKSSRANPFQKSISPPIIQVNPEPPGPALSSDSLPSVEVVVEFPPFPSFQSIADPQRKPKMYEQIVNLALSPNIVTGSRKLRPPPLSEHPNTTCLCKGTVRQPRMIQCDCCIKWYHLSCVHITIWRSRLLRTFVCPPCDRWIHAYTRFDTSRFRRKRQSIVSDLDNEKPFSNACSTSTVVTPVLKRKRSPQPRPQSDDELTDYNPTGTSANQSLQRKPRQRTKATKARSPPEPPSATKRMSTRVRILNILLKILTEAAALTDNPGSITTAQIETLATQIEEETFQQFGVKVDGQVRSCGPRYAAKCRSLRYNLTDPSNPGPRNGLFSGRITPQVLVSLSPEALAPEQIRLLAQEIKQKSIRQSTITEKNAPRMIKKSHKGEVELIPTLFVAMEPDTAAARRENPLGQPSRHRGDENLDDDTLRLSEYLMWKNNQPSTASAGGKDADHSLAHPPSSTTVTQPQVVIPSISELQTPALAKPSPSTCDRSAGSTGQKPNLTTRRKQGSIRNAAERTASDDEAEEYFWLGTCSPQKIMPELDCATPPLEQTPMDAKTPSPLPTLHQPKLVSGGPPLPISQTIPTTPQPVTFTTHNQDSLPPPPSAVLSRPPCHYQPQRPQVSVSRIVQASTPWHGVMALPSGVQFRGKGYHMYDDAWNTQPKVSLTDLIPSHMFIDNKSKSSTVTDYLYKYRYETNRPIVLIRFELDDRTDKATEQSQGSLVPADPASTLQNKVRLVTASPDQQAGAKNFAAFIDYFQQRQAIGVATMSRPGVKRLYIVPLQSSDPIPDVLSWFPETVPTKRDNDYLFALLTLSDFTHVSRTADDPDPTYPSPLQMQTSTTVCSQMPPPVIANPMTMLTPYMGLTPGQTNSAIQQQLAFLSVLLVQNPAALSLVVALSAMAANPNTNQSELAQAYQVLLQATTISAAVGGSSTDRGLASAAEHLTGDIFGLNNGEALSATTMVELTDGLLANSPATTSSTPAPMPPPSPTPTPPFHETALLAASAVPTDQASSHDSAPQTLFGYFRGPLAESYNGNEPAGERASLTNEANASVPHQTSHNQVSASGQVAAVGHNEHQGLVRIDASVHQGSRSLHHERHSASSVMSIEKAPQSDQGAPSAWESDVMLKEAFVPSWGDM